MKKFTIKFLLTLLPLFVLVSFFKFYVNPRITGDLGRLGYIPFGKEYVEYISSLAMDGSYVEQFVAKSDKKYKVLTIGDSFSSFGADGYQNYAGKYLNDTLLNLKIYNGADMVSPEQIAIKLLNNGFYERQGIKVVVVESVERHFISRASNLNFTSNVKTDSIPLLYAFKGDPRFIYPMQKNVIKPKTNIFNRIISLYKDSGFCKNSLEGSFSWVRLSCGFDNPICHAKLNGKYFTDDFRDDDLYFYKQDLKFVDYTDTQINLAKSNIKKIKDLFDSKHIKFIYFVPTDKYHAYQDYIVSNPYPRNNLLDKFNEFSNKDYFFYPKQVIDSLIKKGVKDVYKLNDTHWTAKASDVVGLELARRIKLINP